MAVVLSVVAVCLILTGVVGCGWEAENPTYPSSLLIAFIIPSTCGDFKQKGTGRMGEIKRERERGYRRGRERRGAHWAGFNDAFGSTSGLLNEVPLPG